MPALIVYTKVFMQHATRYLTIDIDGTSIFYRDAGPRDAPALLLLHGLPSSSRMFEPLLLRLADRFRLVAPDYPGFGHSAWPSPHNFSYTFDRYATLMSRFAEAVGLQRYSLYMQDYGGPVGFRMAMSHPQRVASLIVQNAVAHIEGLGDNWALRKAFWEDRRYATSRINRAIHQKNAAMETTTMNANAMFLMLKLNAANEPRAKAPRFCESGARRGAHSIRLLGPPTVFNPELLNIMTCGAHRR